MPKIIISLSISLIILSIFPSLSLFSNALTPEALAGNEGGGGEEVPLTNPIKYGKPADLFAALVKYALGLLASIAVAMIVYGGFTYITSAGNEEKAKQAKAVLTYSIIGVILVLCSYLIINTVIEAVSGK